MLSTSKSAAILMAMQPGKWYTVRDLLRDIHVREKCRSTTTITMTIYHKLEHRYVEVRKSRDGNIYRLNPQGEREREKLIRRRLKALQRIPL